MSLYSNLTMEPPRVLFITDFVLWVLLQWNHEICSTNYLDKQFARHTGKKNSRPSSKVQ
jgi:hypothetical protein